MDEGDSERGESARDCIETVVELQESQVEHRVAGTL